MKTEKKSGKKKRYDYEYDDYTDVNELNYEDEDNNEEDDGDYEVEEEELENYDEIYR